MEHDHRKYLSGIVYAYCNLAYLKERSDLIVTKLTTRQYAPAQILFPTITGVYVDLDTVLPLFKRTALLIQTTQKTLCVSGTNLQKLSKKVIGAMPFKKHLFYIPSMQTLPLNLQFHESFVIAVAYNVYTVTNLFHNDKDEKIIRFEDLEGWRDKLKLYASSADNNIKIMAVLGLNLLEFSR
jgi:hypothetical protein